MEVDPNGNIFRYPESIKGDRHLRDWRLINLIVIERYYKEIFEVAKTWRHKLEIFARPLRHRMAEKDPAAVSRTSNVVLP